MALSKKTRFEIFKRDSFTCQYCGATPPTVVLEVDHIVARARGGADDTDNLVTSCYNCNRGKAAGSLETVPKSLKDKAVEVAEREAQLEAYQKILSGRRQRLEDDTWQVANILIERFAEEGISRGYFLSIKRFIDNLGLDQVIEAMEIAVSRKYSTGQAFRYFCGICWNIIRSANNA